METLKSGTKPVSLLNPSKFGDAERHIKNMVIDSEYYTARENNQQQYADYESILDMIELVRSQANYKWQSNVFIGMLISHMLTEAASWAAQDFSSRDFCDVYLEGKGTDDKKKAQAAKTAINEMLNIKDVYHFQKRMRARTINFIFGQAYALLWWEKKKRKRRVPVSRDQQGEQPLNGEPPGFTEVEEIVYDRFNYDVFDARNVFTDFSYSYSAQQKQWIILRSEKRISELKQDAKKMQYFNIKLLEDMVFSKVNKKKTVKNFPETETSKESYNKIGGAYGTKMPFYSKVDPSVDVLDRYGTIWAIVTKRDEDGVPLSIIPGYDEEGRLLSNGELVEAIVTFAGTGSDYTMIGFKPTWAIDSKGQPYKPIIRSWCYIHPTKDIGLSDGKNLRELNIALNDALNVTIDRTMLATMPMFIGRRDALENNPTIFYEPENLMLVEDIDRDLREMKINDNVTGGMALASFFQSTGSSMDAIWETTQGGLPRSHETATAIVGSENRTSGRAALKGLTWAYTFDQEFYQMMLQLAYRFADNETIIKILGEDLYMHFDAESDYTFVPLSQNIEQEGQKLRKVQSFDQMMGRIIGLAKIAPEKVIPIIAEIIIEQCQLLGMDYRDIAEKMKVFVESPIPKEEGQGAEQTADGSAPPVSNQAGVEMSGQEQMARGM